MARRKRVKVRVKAKVKPNRKARNTLIEKPIIVIANAKKK